MTSGPDVRLTAQMVLAAGAPRPDPVAYMAEVAATEPGRTYKSHVLAQLDLRPGLAVVDVGCGPGVDLADLASGVSPDGSVIGVDIDPVMVAAARDRLAEHGNVEIKMGDSHHLPLASGVVDRARTDRALQHMAAPAEALAELRRVLRPGGLAVLAEPDWGSFAIDADDVATSQAFAAYTATVVRNPLIGRQLARLADRAGFHVDEVRPFASTFRDFHVADQVLGLSRNTAAAVAVGDIEAEAAQQWLTALREGPMLATVLLYVVTLRT